MEDGRLLVAREVDMVTGAVRLDAALATDGVHFDGERLLTIHADRAFPPEYAFSQSP
ncbi:hypothetical protein PQR27_38130 [Paraburkholderia fungorum]|uniref:hypothetical protein n=1 Tax=Paraburkholderia fungorum TaxID=134537 RepID=UPI0038BDD53D